MKKTVLAIAFLVLSLIPTKAVFNEKDLSLTLSVLRHELGKAYSEMEASQKQFLQRDEKQHGELLELMDRCNELSLMLYSQRQDFTFDLTYALRQVTDQYQSFTEKRLPFDEIIEYLEIEIDRYARLVRSLRLIPPAVSAPQDSLGEALIDSLATSLVKYIREADRAWGLTLDSTGIARGRRGGEALDSRDASLTGQDSERLGGQPDGEDFPTSLRTLSSRGGELYLDSRAAADRDSCLVYATGVLKMLLQARSSIVQDSDSYNQTNARLKEFFDYAQDRYSLVQKNLFLKGQDDYLSVLRSVGAYTKAAFKDAADKYGVAGSSEAESEWRGPLVIGFPFTVLVYLLIVSLLSSLVLKILVRRVEALRTLSFRKRQHAWHLTLSLLVFIIGLSVARLLASGSYFFSMASSLLCEFVLLVLVVMVSVLARISGLKIYNAILLHTPALALGLLVITCRIIFIPNSLVTLLFPPLLAAFALWQLLALRKQSEQVPLLDRSLARASFVVMAATLCLALGGYVLLGLQVYIWWIFQLSTILFVHTCKALMLRYPKKRIDKRTEKYLERMRFFDTGKKGSLVEVTWLYDFIQMVVIPQLYVLSFPASIFWASGVFDLTSVAMNIFHIPFLNASFIHISIAKLILVGSLFFLFDFAAYLLRGLYRVARFKSVMRRSGADFVQENEVNLTLANNILGILVWGVYAVTAIAVLRIPTKSLSVVSAGLAAGLGFAMKDILNNFFYGVQLMSGRLKVGDWIDCDGVRGRVDQINYQSTQIVAKDGSVMEFPNSALFSKNFRNLTKNDNYECVALPVGVAYGTSIEQVRTLLTEALSALRVRDKFGREVVEPSYGIKVVLEAFGDSSVDLLVKQYVLVETRTSFIASANEVIYNTLNKNNIEIPFPQRDINIRQVPAAKPKNE